MGKKSKQLWVKKDKIARGKIRYKVKEVKKLVVKRFPATVTLQESTFLNDKKVNGELYAFLQGVSYVNEEQKTVVYKKDLPTQKAICEKIGIKSPKTFRTHMKYLIENGYINEEEECYILTEKENIYFMIPLNTLQFLNDTLKEQVIKIYIYLGQRHKYKPNYEFTVAELAAHIGVKLDGNKRGYEIIDNALDCLKLLGLIDYVVFYDGQKPKRRLTKFSLQKPGV